MAKLTPQEKLERATAKACERAMVNAVESVAGSAILEEMEKIAEATVKDWLKQNKNVLLGTVREAVTTKLDAIRDDEIKRIVKNLNISFDYF